MPKQSATNPRFRCNECKDYHSAPEHKTHSQCAVHGYLCNNYVSYQTCTINVKSDRAGYFRLCGKDVIIYNWHEDVGRWIEEGLEEEKAKAKPKVKSKTKPDYLKEINVLLDLLEDDTLTKEVFIKKMREKLK